MGKTLSPIAAIWRDIIRTRRQISFALGQHTRLKKLQQQGRLTARQLAQMNAVENELLEARRLHHSLMEERKRLKTGPAAHQ